MKGKPPPGYSIGNKQLDKLITLVLVEDPAKGRYGQDASPTITNYGIPNSHLFIIVSQDIIRAVWMVLFTEYQESMYMQSSSRHLSIQQTLDHLSNSKRAC